MGLPSPCVSDSETLCRISRMGGKLIQIQVANIMDLRKMYSAQAGLVPHHKPDNVKERVFEVYELFSQFAKEKNVQFRAEVDPNVPDYLLCDGVRIEQCLVNYLEQAFEETARGEIVIQMFWKDKDCGSRPAQSSASNLRSAPDLISLANNSRRGSQKSQLFCTSSIDGNDYFFLKGS